KTQRLVQRWENYCPHQRHDDEHSQQSVITLGTAASRSMKNCSVSEIRGGANSARKIAAPIPRGTAMSRATADVTSVPYMNGSAPYWSMFGSHTRVTKKCNPNFARASAEPVHSSYTSSSVISTTVAANTIVVSRAISSPSRKRDRKEREPITGPAFGRVVLTVATFLAACYWMLLIAFFSFSTISFGSFA